MRRMLCGALCAVAVAAASTAQAQFFADDFDDGNAMSRWSAPIISLENPELAFDGSVDYAFDYSAIGAGSAPNSVGGSTIGIAMETNLTDAGPVNEGESVAVIPLAGLGGEIPNGDFKFSADVYLFWNGGTGSTEYATFGVFSQGTAAPLRFGLNPGDGLAWQWDTDGDSTVDFVRFENPAGTEVDLGGYEDIPNGTIPGVTTGPSIGSRDPQMFNQWLEVAITSVDDILYFSINGAVLDTFDNTGGQFSGGSLVIGQSDPFNSVNFDNADGLSNLVVFDNVVIGFVPEPTTALLLAASLVGLNARRRRS